MAWRCGTSEAIRPISKLWAVRKPWEAAVPVAQANRRRASESLDDVPHRPRLPSDPPLGPTHRLPDLYGSLSTLLGIMLISGHDFLAPPVRAGRPASLAVGCARRSAKPREYAGQRRLRRCPRRVPTTLRGPFDGEATGVSTGKRSCPGEARGPPRRDSRSAQHGCLARRPSLPWSRSFFDARELPPIQKHSPGARHRERHCHPVRCGHTARHGDTARHGEQG